MSTASEQHKAAGDRQGADLHLEVLQALEEVHVKGLQRCRLGLEGGGHLLQHNLVFEKTSGDSSAIREHTRINNQNMEATTSIFIPWH